MNTTTRAIRGTSAYTFADEPATGPFEEVTWPSASGSAKERAVEWDRLIDELLRIRGLKGDWDGDGAVAPEPALVHGAIRWAQSFKEDVVDPADRVIASVNGTIYFEWHSPVDYAELELTSPVEGELRTVEKGTNRAAAVTLSYR